jgi:recombination protein RecA
MTMSLEKLAASLESAFAKQGDDTAKGSLDFGYKPLNRIVSGLYDEGLKNSKMIEICGDPSTGKTAIATAMMARAQEQGGVAIFEDCERSFNPKFASRLGLDVTTPGRFLYRKPRTWEQANMEMCRFAKMVRDSGAIASDAPIIAVLDSVAAAVPQSVLTDSKGKEREIDELNMSDTTALARVASSTLKIIKQHMDDFNFTTVYLNQTRVKPGVVYGDPTTTPGGKAFEFYADARVFLRRAKVTDADKEFIGQLITAEAKKTKFTRPFQECKLRLMFEEDGYGYFDIELSTIEYLLEIGRLSKSGNYVVWLDGKNYYPKALADKVRKEKLIEELNKLFPPIASSAA